MVQTCCFLPSSFRFGRFPADRFRVTGAAAETPSRSSVSPAAPVSGLFGRLAKPCSRDAKTVSLQSGVKGEAANVCHVAEVTFVLEKMYFVIFFFLFSITGQETFGGG